MDWHEAKKGEDTRSFDKMIADIAQDMNTSVEMVLHNYLVCRYSRFQLSDNDSRMRAASKVNDVIRQSLVSVSFFTFHLIFFLVVSYFFELYWKI